MKQTAEMDCLSGTIGDQQSRHSRLYVIFFLSAASPRTGTPGIELSPGLVIGLARSPLRSPALSSRSPPKATLTSSTLLLLSNTPTPPEHPTHISPLHP